MGSGRWLIYCSFFWDYFLAVRQKRCRTSSTSWGCCGAIVVGTKPVCSEMFWSCGRFPAKWDVVGLEILCLHCGFYMKQLYISKKFVFESESSPQSCFDFFSKFLFFWCHKVCIWSKRPTILDLWWLLGTEEGMNFLRRAQVMYHQRPQAVKDVCEERCENNYTMTMPLDRKAFWRSWGCSTAVVFCFESSIAPIRSGCIFMEWKGA